MISLSSLLAQATSQSTGGPATPAPAMDTSFLFMMLAMGGIIYFLMIRPQSKERKKREEMLGQLKKNDKVNTIGGIVGTVWSVNEDKGEVTLKVDESSNTKITFLKAAIQRVITSGGSAAATESDSGRKG